MPRNLVLALSVGLLGGSVWAQNAVPPRTDTARVRKQAMPELTFQDLPLEQVVQWLGEFTQLNISVRWQTLQDVGVDRDKPITVRARNLRLSQVLWRILYEAGGSEVKLAYRASGNLLVLSTAADLDKELVTKVYDVSDLLIRLPRASRQGALDVTQGLGQQTAGTGSGSAASIFPDRGSSGPDRQDEIGTRTGEQELQQLVHLIQETVEPDTWRAHEGPGTIVPYQRSLIVRNTILVHQLLGGYLTEGEVAGP